MSPDGKNVYVVSGSGGTLGGGSVDVFTRHKPTGTLTQLADPDGYVTSFATTGCPSGRALDGAQAVAVSPNGKNVEGGRRLSQATLEPPVRSARSAVDLNPQIQ